MKAIAIFLAIFVVGCAEEKQQIVVPAVGASRMSAEQRSQAISALRAEFPKLKPNAAEAIESISRAFFVTQAARHRAYEDKALPIGSAQSTLKLSDIAWLLSEIDIQPHAQVLEIGTGTGYFAAVMSRLAAKVYSVEIIEYLAEVSRSTLARFQIENVKIRNSDGLNGWPIYAPYDVIIVTAAVRELPQALIEQLTPAGMIAAPIRSEGLCQWIIYKNNNGKLEEVSKRISNVPDIIESTTTPLE